MFSALQLTNFRSFKQSGPVSFGRLNILIGANSSGKSSLLSSLLLLKQTLEDANLENFLVTDGRIVNLGGFTDLAFAHSPLEGIGISLTLDRDFIADRFASFNLMAERGNPRAKPIEPTRVDLRFGCNRRNRQFYIKNAQVVSEDGLIILKAGCYSNGKTAWVESSLAPQLKPSAISFSHFLPSTWGKKPARSIEGHNLSRVLLRQQGVWERAFRDMTYIGPVRNTIQMRYPVTGESPTGVGVRGENLLAVLFQDQRSSRRRRRFLLTKLNKWLEGHFGFVTDIKLEPLTKDRSVYALTGLDPRTSVRVNLSQVGFGVSQAAPIIVQGFLSPEKSCMLIEQPEIHLHPAAQADLGDLFIEIMREGKQLFIETHSEHMILRIRRRIAEGAIEAGLVKLLFVDKGKEGSTVTPLELDARGQISNWPKGFFEEGYAESIKIVEAVQSKVGD
jgi:hypothetical protein